MSTTPTTDDDDGGTGIGGPAFRELFPDLDPAWVRAQAARSRETPAVPATQQDNRAEVAVMGAGVNAGLGVLLASAVAAVPAYVLFIWLRVRGAAATGHQLGRKWLAWVVSALVLTSLPSALIHFDANHFVIFLIGLVSLSPVSYGLGWAYWKLVREKPWKRITNTMDAGADNQLYEIAWNEIQSGNMATGLWARSYAICAGNEEKTRALYVKERVKQLGKSAAE